MTLILSGTDGVSDVDGSAATPAVRGADTNTGIFFPAADTIAFAEGGVEVMRLDASGNMGLGTASPSQRLQVNGSSAAVLITGPTNTSGMQLGVREDGQDVQVLNNGNGGAIRLATNSGSGATERFRIASAGQIGIGGANYGTNGQVLTSAGSGAAPTWTTPSSGALVFISSVTASNSATVSFTGLNSTYDIYMVELVNLVTVNAFLQMRMSTNNGSSYVTTNYRFSSIGGANTTSAAEVDSLTGNASFIRLMCNNAGSISGTESHGGMSGFVHVVSPAASNFTRVMFQESHAVDATTNGFSFGSGMYASSTPVNAIQFYMSSSENIVSGTFRLYGIANS